MSDTHELEPFLYNVGYNVPEFKSLTFNWCLYQHAFLYFQGPAIVEGKKIDSGACILYPKYTLHNYTTLKGFVNSYVGFKHPSAEIFTKLSIKTGKVIYPDNCAEINDIIHEIYVEEKERRRGWEEAASGLILKLLVAISRGTQVKHETEKTLNIKETMTKLREDYLSDLRNVPETDELILKSGLSRTRFYRLYSELFHVSPKDDLIWARLTEAKKLMRENPEVKMYSIAADCGFEEVSHFFHLFKQRYGYTPKDYAKAAALSMEDDE